MVHSHYRPHDCFARPPLLAKGLSHGLFLEAGVLLVSIQLILGEEECGNGKPFGKALYTNRKFTAGTPRWAGLKKGDIGRTTTRTKFMTLQIALEGILSQQPGLQRVRRGSRSIGYSSRRWPRIASSEPPYSFLAASDFGLAIVSLRSASNVTSTWAPGLSCTSLPFSSVNEFSIRISRYNSSAPSTSISAFQAGWDEAA
jgi:hypothetical protein